MADIEELRARIEALEAGATCPHVVTSDEGTSYCGLAEQQVAASAPPKPAPAGSLVERVAIACAKPCNETWDDQARAAIREVADWMRESSVIGWTVDQALFNLGKCTYEDMGFEAKSVIVELIEQEAER